MLTLTFPMRRVLVYLTRQRNAIGQAKLQAALGRTDHLFERTLEALEREQLVRVRRRADASGIYTLTDRGRELATNINAALKDARVNVEKHMEFSQ